MTLTLTKLSETGSTITLGWTPPTNVGAYVFYANGQIVSTGSVNLKDGTPRNSVKFSKASPGGPFEVGAIIRGGSGLFTAVGDAYPDAPPPPANVAVSAPTGIIR